MTLIEKENELFQSGDQLRVLCIVSEGFETLLDEFRLENNPTPWHVDTEKK